jgi:hypothetical protein
LRFEVHRPAQRRASPRGHRASHGGVLDGLDGDVFAVACGVDVGVGPVPAGRAPDTAWLSRFSRARCPQMLQVCDVYAGSTLTTRPGAGPRRGVHQACCSTARFHMYRACEQCSSSPASWTGDGHNRNRDTPRNLPTATDKTRRPQCRTVPRFLPTLKDRVSTL